jgi:hypothetical protein
VFRRSRLGWSILEELSHHITPACARALPPSYVKVMCRLPPSGHTLKGAGGRDGLTILSETSTKFGISEHGGASPQLRRLQPGGPHSRLGTYLEMTQHASLLKPA